MKWHEWKDYFINYMVTIDNDGLTPVIKKGILLHSLGPEGIKQYNKMEKKARGEDETNVYMNALDDLERYYAPTVCVAIDRYKFFRRKQEQNETIDDYLASLKNMAEKCRFGMIEEELIGDQVIMLTSNKRVQERLWAMGDGTLSKVLAVVRKAEISVRCAKAALEESKGKEEVCVVQEKKMSKGSNRKAEREREFKQDRDRGKEYRDQRRIYPTRGEFKKESREVLACSRCGSYEHLANSRVCRARDQRCTNCGLIGHYAWACKRKDVRSKVKYVAEKQEKSDTEEECSEEEDVVIMVNDAILDVKTKETNPLVRL